MTRPDDGVVRPVVGRLFAARDRVLVLAMPLPSSLPIPLGIREPAGVALTTWAFAGLASDDPVGPRTLLVLAAEGEAEARLRRGPLVVATHYRDIVVAHDGVRPLADLPAEDRAVLVRAVLSAGTVAPVAGLVDLFEEAGGTLEPVSDAPRIAFQGSAACTLDGAEVPNHLLLRAHGRWALARVASARLNLGEPTRTALRLDSLWGAPDEAPDSAVALHAHGFTPLRVGVP